MFGGVLEEFYKRLSTPIQLNHKPVSALHFLIAGLNKMVTPRIGLDVGQESGMVAISRVLSQEHGFSNEQLHYNGKS